MTAHDLLSLRIDQIIPETTDARTLVLHPTNGGAGVETRVPYRAGQFLTLLLQPDGHEVRRSYSLSSAPHEPQLCLTIKRVPNGAISRYLLDHVRVGDVLTSLPPAGRFVLDEPPTDGRDVVLLGAGSGITPLFSILKAVLHSEPRSRVTLLYSNTRERSVIFREALNQLATHYVDRFRLIHLLSQPTDDATRLRGTVRTGRLNNTLLEQLLPELIRGNRTNARFYLCGPFEYMRMAQITLTFAGIRAEQIRHETFVIEPVRPTTFAQQRRAFRVLLRYRGQTHHLTVPAHRTLLQAALDQHIQLPYSCRGGRCSTCVARCTAGRVGMMINDVLTDRDLAEGLILTCTAYPETEGVVVEV